MSTEAQILPNHERPQFQGIVRRFHPDDVSALKPILETWIKNRHTGELIPEEVADDLDQMEKSYTGENDITYLVAEENGEVLGVMGFRPPEEKMKQYGTTENPAELINAYVSNDHRHGKGVGTALIRALEEQARLKGHTEIILNSGPRYQFSGWGFYIKQYGKPVGKAIGMYGKGGDAPIWRHLL